MRGPRSGFVQPGLAGVLVDSHFAQRDREGRLFAFLARGAELEDGRFRVVAARRGAVAIDTLDVEDGVIVR